MKNKNRYSKLLKIALAMIRSSDYASVVPSKYLIVGDQFIGYI